MRKKREKERRQKGGSKRDEGRGRKNRRGNGTKRQKDIRDFCLHFYHFMKKEKRRQGGREGEGDRERR
jgi:hypothetical protein